MNSSILLNEADKSRLERITETKPFPPGATGDLSGCLVDLLAAARVAEPHDRLEGHVGFHDDITLLSIRDSADYYKFRIVMPHEADTDADRISVLTPICLATLGRASGELVSWNTAAGHRLMRIISIHKFQDDIPVNGDALALQPGLASTR